MRRTSSLIIIIIMSTISSPISSSHILNNNNPLRPLLKICRPKISSPVNSIQNLGINLQINQSVDLSIKAFDTVFLVFWFCFCAPGRRVRKSCFFARIARSPSSANPSPDCGAFQSWLPNLSTTHYGKWRVSVKEQQIQCRHSQIWSSKIVVVAGMSLLFSSHHDNNIPIRSTISAVNNPF